MQRRLKANIWHCVGSQKDDADNVTILNNSKQQHGGVLNNQQ